jgi:hypothetical protein
MFAQELTKPAGLVPSVTDLGSDLPGFLFSRANHLIMLAMTCDMIVACEPVAKASGFRRLCRRNLANIRRQLFASTL